ncbi:MAG: putative sulfate exporter family transporter [Firmicutes bacterium]|nr:putative sulfate exporter family transporter [Bacillota bacterium]
MRTLLSHPVLFFLLLAIVVIAPINAAGALAAGLVLALFNLVPASIPVATWAKKTLAVAVVGLGFGIQLSAAAALGREYAVTLMSLVILTLLAAWWVTRWLKVDSKTGFLIASGTAICGGSAIAAVAPAIRARTDQIAVALGCVFILNALALLLFPWVGQLLNLEPELFGVWAALAIHDTSSVVGAAQAYHVDAVAPATTLKLARALLIVPVVLVGVWLFNTQAPSARATLSKVPSFIIWFVLAMVVANVVVTWWPQAGVVFDSLTSMARQLLVASLFFVGASLRVSLIRQAGLKPILLATLLWVGVAAGSLAALLHPS